MAKTATNVALGAIGGASMDLIVDLPVNYLLGYVPAIKFHEGFTPTNPQVWSIRFGDVVTSIVGGAMAIMGKNTVKETGIGMLTGVGVVKTVELLAYLSAKAGVTYQEVSPVPLSAKTPHLSETQRLNRAMPQNQLMVGRYTKVSSETNSQHLMV